MQERRRAYVLPHHPDRYTDGKFSFLETKMGSDLTNTPPPPAPLLPHPKIITKSQPRTRPAGGVAGAPAARPRPGQRPRGGGCFPWPAAGRGGDGAGRAGPGAAPSPGHDSGATSTKQQPEQLLFSCCSPHYRSALSFSFPVAT